MGTGAVVVAAAAKGRLPVETPASAALGHFFLVHAAR